MYRYDPPSETIDAPQLFPIVPGIVRDSVVQVFVAYLLLNIVVERCHKLAKENIFEILDKKHFFLSSQNFETSKTICDEYGQKVKKTVFFKTIFGFLKLDISWTFINVQFSFPFLLLGIFLHFSK